MGATNVSRTASRLGMRMYDSVTNNEWIATGPRMYQTAIVANTPCDGGSARRDRLLMNRGQRLRRQVHWLIALAFCGAIDAASAATTLPLEECRLQSDVLGGSAAARCGWLEVPE